MLCRFLHLFPCAASFCLALCSANSSHFDLELQPLSSTHLHYQVPFGFPFPSLQKVELSSRFFFSFSKEWQSCSVCGPIPISENSYYISPNFLVYLHNSQAEAKVSQMLFSVRYNSYPVKFTVLKSTIQCFLVVFIYLQSCVTITTF